MVFSSVIKLPKKYVVFDCTKEHPVPDSSLHDFGVGKYLEKRPHIYKAPGFGQRVVHMGVDIQAPPTTEVYSFFDGEFFGVKNNNLPQDYGYTLILKYQLKKQNLQQQFLPNIKLPEQFDLWALYGHLSRSVMTLFAESGGIKKGQCIGHIGDKSENGGWQPHLHFQICLEQPSEVYMPGVLSPEQALLDQNIYLDPRIILGAIY